MKELRVRVTLTEQMLGTCAADPSVHATYIASKAPDAKSREEEIEALGADAVFEKSMTIFLRDEDGDPALWNYQIKGFLKAAASALSRCKGEKFSKATCAIKAHRKVIDTNVFVEPRILKIHMPEGGEIGICQRPLRASTAQGERIALSSSESVPAGSWIEFTIVCLSDSHVDAVKEWLDYGRYSGLGAWRNSSMGTFSYEIIDEGENVTDNKTSGVA